MIRFLDTFFVVVRDIKWLLQADYAPHKTCSSDV